MADDRVGDEATSLGPSNLFPEDGKQGVINYLRADWRRLPVNTIESRGLEKEGRSIDSTDEASWPLSDEPTTKTYRFEDRRVADDTVFSAIASQSQTRLEDDRHQLSSLRGQVAGKEYSRVLRRMSLPARGINTPEKFTFSAQEAHMDFDSPAVHLPLSPRKVSSYTVFADVASLPEKTQSRVSPIPSPQMSAQRFKKGREQVDGGKGRVEGPWPTTRMEYKALNQDRMPTLRRQQNSLTSRQPRSDSPLAVLDQYDHSIHDAEKRSSGTVNEYSTYSVREVAVNRSSSDLASNDHSIVGERRDVEFSTIGRETLSMQEFKENFKHTIRDPKVVTFGSPSKQGTMQKSSEMGQDATTESHNPSYSHSQGNATHKPVPTRVFSRASVWDERAHATLSTGHTQSSRSYSTGHKQGPSVVRSGAQQVISDAYC
jgi:hypothetical protein